MNIVCFGAHPDDCEAYAGGSCVKWARLGHSVLFVSMTNGDAGHHEMGGGALAQRRMREAAESAARGGVEGLILGYHDGELMPTLEARRDVVRIIREHKADIVISHRACDYHPDHRYASILVQDASFMVTVPNFCPGTPRLAHNPVFVYMMGARMCNVPFSPDIAVAVDDAMDTKYDMLDAMESQIYEWLPWLDGQLEDVPKDADARKQWMREGWDPSFQARADEGRDVLAKWYGKEAAEQTRYAELFEVCPYGAQPTREELRELFPFFPAEGA